MLSYVVMSILAAVILYDDWRMGIFFLCGLPFYIRRRRKKQQEEQKLERSIQFKDALFSIGSALEAGYAMENAVTQANRDLDCIYPEESWIRRELTRMEREMANAIPVSDALTRFARESGLEDAESFAQLYATAKRSGGDMLAIIRSAGTMIADKTETAREIRTVLTAKQLECKVMRLIPPGILIYFRAFSPGFLDYFYEGAGGRISMTIFLGLYLFLVWQMERIVCIEV